MPVAKVWEQGISDPHLVFTEGGAQVMRPGAVSRMPAALVSVPSLTHIHVRIDSLPKCNNTFSIGLGTVPHGGAFGRGKNTIGICDDLLSAKASFYRHRQKVKDAPKFEKGDVIQMVCDPISLTATFKVVREAKGGSTTIFEESATGDREIMSTVCVAGVTLPDDCSASLVSAEPATANAAPDTPAIAKAAAVVGDQDLGNWLNKAGLSTFAQAFIDNGVDAVDMLTEFSDDELREIGLKIGHIKKFRAALAANQAAPPVATGCSQLSSSAATAFAPTDQRKYNRWGDGLDAPTAGARPFFPSGFVPSALVPEALTAFQPFGYNDQHISKLMESGHMKSQELCSIGFNIAPQHCSTLEAYTEEPGFYKDLNYTCRTPGKITDKKLEKYRDYLYHAEQALSSLDSFVGETFRGTDNYMADHVYMEGATVTFQQLCSASKSQIVAKRFLRQDGPKLIGSMFCLKSTTGKSIEFFSAFPEEKEVLFKFNSHFKVQRRIANDTEKKTILSDLSAYNLAELHLYILQQI